MGACFHIAGVTCDNCRPFTGKIIGGPIINTGRSIGDLMGDYPPPLATAAEVAALRAEVARLTEAVKGLSAAFESQPRVCPACNSTDIEGAPYILTSAPPQQDFTCKVCGHGWREVV